MNAAQDFLMASGNWQADPNGGPNALSHAAWLARSGDYQEAAYNYVGVSAIADANITVVNAKLKEWRFDIQLAELPGVDALALAARNVVSVRWQEPGQVAPYDGHAGFSLAAGVSVVEDDKLPSPQVRIRTAAGDTVCIQECAEPGSWDELLAKVAYVAEVGRAAGRSITGAVVKAPMVKLDVQPDVSWLCGLRLGGFFVAQALQQIIFGMNHLGVEAREATAMTMLRGLAPKPLVFTITKPFLIWIERDGLKVPVLQAYIGRECWQDPGDLAAL